MKEVTLHQHQQARLHVLNSVLAEEIRIGQAAELMDLSERHVRRLLGAYRELGAEALAHGNRDRRPHNAVPEAVAAAVVRLAATRYPGANHTHLTELLEEHEGLALSRPTVRRILTRAGSVRLRSEAAGLWPQPAWSRTAPHAWCEPALRETRFAPIVADASRNPPRRCRGEWTARRPCLEWAAATCDPGCVLVNAERRAPAAGA